METRGLFVTGTDTGVGKTAAASLIARECREQGLLVGAYKPVCSGAEVASGEPLWADVEALSRAIGGGWPRDRICPQRFVAPVAPPVAARLEGREVDAALLREGARWWNERVELLVVEGAGGLLCPLSDADTAADLAGDLGYPLIVVVRLGLGCINHALLTLEVAESRGLAVAGLILNEVDPPAKAADERGERAEIVRRCHAPVLGVMQHNRSDRLLRDGEAARIKWLDLASQER